MQTPKDTTAAHESDHTSLSSSTPLLAMLVRLWLSCCWYKQRPRAHLFLELKAGSQVWVRINQRIPCHTLRQAGHLVCPRCNVLSSCRQLWAQARVCQEACGNDCKVKQAFITCWCEDANLQTPKITHSDRGCMIRTTCRRQSALSSYAFQSSANAA